MNEKGTTMQSEEVEDVVTSKDDSLSIIKSEMTFSDTRDSVSPSSNSQVNLGTFKSIQDADYKLSEINYEADIEKMVPESSNSSDSEDGSKLEVVPSDSPVPETSTEPLKHLQEAPSNESIRTWLQKISQMQTEIQQKLSLEQNSSPTDSFAEFSSKSSNFTQISTPTPPQPTTRVVKYQDLPYMGEMTLDNSKPRRGRKPKKADICHLIYKNYGTIFPGTPNPKSLLDRESNSKKPSVDKTVDINLNDPLNRSDVQNRIISSLLEKRLTQETKRQKQILFKPSKITQKPTEKASSQHEPLNLCVRDLNQLKIRLLRKSDDTYIPEVKSEPATDDEVEFVQETPSPASVNSDLKFPNSDNKFPNIDFKFPNSDLKFPSSDLKLPNSDIKFPNLTPEAFSAAFLAPDAVKIPENGAGPGGYVYWPNAGVFIHPMALQQQLMYYQKMSQNNNYTLPSQSPKPIPEALSSPETPPVPELRKLVPKLRPKKPDVTTEIEPPSPTDQKPKRNACGVEKSPVKRKRSAIFIPPIPAENQTNPATEVSICKFKFTGGAKPSLQEKKMLSVDSGGNFRYYSGTGDKSMRGYEFFPRETLQQQIGNTQGSSTGAFLQASGEKIRPGNMVDFTGKQAHSDFMLTPELPAASIPRLPDLSPRQKKRKSRKSLQREKLEQTFKEKGFLIQTQQLESAEGATYCKFRQLRKFTRYLFRSWKDYLPGNVAEVPEGERSEGEEMSEQDLENLARLSQNGLGCSSSDIPTTV